MPDPGSPWERENPADGKGYITMTTTPNQTEYDRLKAQKDAILAKRESRIVAALREQHEWHLAQTEADEHGVIPAEAYSESAMCDRTLAALQSPTDSEGDRLLREIGETKPLDSYYYDDLQDRIDAHLSRSIVGEGE